MLTFTIIAAIAIAQAQPRQAPTLILWNNLYSGMSKAQFKSLWPKLRTALGEGCFADIGAGFSHGKLESVTLEWSGSDTNKRCAEVVSGSLHTKYGKPRALAQDVEVGDCGDSSGGGLFGALSALCEGMGGEDPTSTKYYRWVNDGVEITLKRNLGSEALWWLEYRAAIEPSKDVSNKL